MGKQLVKPYCCAQQSVLEPRPLGPQPMASPTPSVAPCSDDSIYRVTQRAGASESPLLLPQS